MASPVARKGKSNAKAKQNSAKRGLYSRALDEAEFKDMGMDYWLRRTQEVLERVEG